MPTKTPTRTRQDAREARKRRAAAALKKTAPSGKKEKKRSKIASDESVATSDKADDSGSESSAGNTPKTNTGKGGKPDRNGPPTILKVLDQLLDKKSTEDRNDCVRQLIVDLEKGTPGAKQEFASLLQDNMFSPILLMSPRSAFPQVGHSLFRYISNVRHGDENHGEGIIFLGDRDQRGDPVAFAIDPDIMDSLGKTTEVDGIADDNALTEFIQDSDNDGKLLRQGAVAGMGSDLVTKEYHLFTLVSPAVAAYVLRETPSLQDFELWLNDPENMEISDDETDALNEWTKLSIQSADGALVRKTSSIIAHPFSAIAGPSDELKERMKQHLNFTIGRVKEAAPQAQDNEETAKRWERRLEAQEKSHQEDKAEAARLLDAAKDKLSDATKARICAWSGQGHWDNCSPTLMKIVECTDVDDALGFLQEGCEETADTVRLRLTNTHVPEDMMKLLMKGRFMPAAAGMKPLTCNVSKTCGHMLNVQMTSEQREELAMDQRAASESKLTRTFIESRKMEEKEISGKLARPPPSSHKELSQIVDDSIVMLTTLLTKKSPLVKLYEEVEIVLRRITEFAGDIPAETWRNLSAHLHYDETQFYSTKASEANVLDGINLPTCTMNKAGILQQLLTSRTVPEIHNVIPPWKATSRRARDPPLDEIDHETDEIDHSASYEQNVPTVVRALMAPYWKKKTGIQVTRLCTLAGVGLTDLPAAFKGLCINKFLGKCNSPRCPRNHDFSSVSAEDTESLCRIIEPGVKKAIADGGDRWW